MRKSIFWSLNVVCLTAMGAFAAMQTSGPNLPKTLEAQIRLAEQNPTNADVINDLGNLLVMSRRAEEAEAAYRRAIELAPGKTQARFNLALLLQQRGQRQKALEEFAQVVAQEPDHAWTHYQMGAIYEAQALKAKAVESYAKAFRLDQSLASAENNPHIIENSLVVEAMIRAYRELAVQPLAPKTFDDPARIANLLIASKEVEAMADAGEEEEGAERIAAEGKTAGGMVDEQMDAEAAAARRSLAAGRGNWDDEQAAVEDDEEELAEGGGGSRVLSTDTIESGSQQNQVRGGSSGSRASRGGVLRGNYPTPSAPTRSGRTTIINQGGTTTRIGPSPTEDGPPSRYRPPTRYRPSVRSTGSLEFQLRPADPSRTLWGK